MRVYVADVIGAAAELGGITPADITGDNLTRCVTCWRRRAMFVARDLCGVSFPSLGRKFRRDHSTVLVACRAQVRATEAEPGEADILAALSVAATRRAIGARWQATEQPLVLEGAP